jgi:hypothetical protein
MFLLSIPKNRIISIPDITLLQGAKATLVGEKNTDLRLTALSGKAQIELPEKLAYQHAFLIKISGLAD